MQNENITKQFENAIDLTNLSEADLERLSICFFTVLSKT